MALPAKGDPRRPLHLAIRSTRVLGVILLLFGTCALMPFMMYVARSGPRAAASGPLAWIIVALVFFIPGALFIVLSMFLGRRQSWSIVCALVLSSLLALFFLFAFTGYVEVVLREEELSVWTAIPVVLALFGLAVGQLIYHLCKSFEAIKYPPFGQDFRGFEPLPVRPVVSAPVDPPPPANPQSGPVG